MNTIEIKVDRLEWRTNLIVICIENVHISGGISNVMDLTIGEKYKADEALGDYYRLVSDKGFLGDYSKRYFITLNEFRSSQIDKIL